MKHKDCSHHVIITGAAGGLGKHVVSTLLHAGMQVSGFCLHSSEADALIKFLEPQDISNLDIYLCNSNDSTSVQQQVAACTTKRGSAFALVHTVGGFHYDTVEDSTEETFDRMIQSNLKSSWLMSRSLLPSMKKSGKGRLIFVSSRSTLGLGEEGMSLYLASKAGLNAFVQCLAREGRKFGITANAVLPSIIDTPTNRQEMPQADFSSWVNPADLANFIKTLLTPSSDSINGALIPFVSKL